MRGKGKDGEDHDDEPRHLHAGDERHHAQVVPVLGQDRATVTLRLHHHTHTGNTHDTRRIHHHHQRDDGAYAEQLRRRRTAEEEADQEEGEDEDQVPRRLDTRGDLLANLLENKLN